MSRTNAGTISNRRTEANNGSLMEDYERKGGHTNIKCVQMVEKAETTHEEHPVCKRQREEQERKQNHTATSLTNSVNTVTLQFQLGNSD